MSLLVQRWSCMSCDHQHVFCQGSDSSDSPPPKAQALHLIVISHTCSALLLGAIRLPEDQ